MTHILARHEHDNDIVMTQILASARPGHGRTRLSVPRGTATVARAGALFSLTPGNVVLPGAPIRDNLPGKAVRF